MDYYFTADQPRMFSEPVPATVEQTITVTQPGRVKYKGTFWPARIYQSNNKNSIILANQPVTVIGIAGITLLIVVA